MLIKKGSAPAGRSRLSGLAAAAAAQPLDRRGFLRNSGLAASGLAAAAALPMTMVRKAEAGPVVRAEPVKRVKSVCTHCSVGCTVIAEVQNGVWVGQEPGWDSPISQGTHCAKGASVRELTSGDRRTKYPTKLVRGEWKRISWDQ